MKIFLIAAVTADGFIARDATHLSTKWTSKEDAKWFNTRTKQAGVMVMGRKTFETIGRGLPGRVTIVLSKKPSTVIKQFPDVEELSTDLGPHLEEGRVYVTDANPDQVTAIVEQQQFSELAVCGGSAIYTAFMKAGLIQTLYLTLEPKCFGKGMSLFSEDLETELKLEKFHRLSAQTTVVEYSVSSN